MEQWSIGALETGALWAKSGAFWAKSDTLLGKAFFDMEE